MAPTFDEHDGDLMAEISRVRRAAVQLRKERDAARAELAVLRERPTCPHCLDESTADNAGD